MTYRELAKLISEMTDEQKDTVITVEDPWEYGSCRAELRIADTNYDSLDNGHPVIYMLD